MVPIEKQAEIRERWPERTIMLGGSLTSNQGLPETLERLHMFVQGHSLWVVHGPLCSCRGFRCCGAIRSGRLMPSGAFRFWTSWWRCRLSATDRRGKTTSARSKCRSTLGSQDGVLYDAGCPILSGSGLTHVIPETGARATACLRLNNGFSSREGDML